MKDDCLVFEGNNCINNMLDHILAFEGEAN